MAVDPMSSAWAKYHWARKHVEAVDAAMGRSFDPKLHPVTFDTEVERGGLLTATAIIRIQKLPTIRPDFGLALGDALHNFRSALDHLAWALVKVGATPRPKKPRNVYFPMAESFGEFRGRIGSWLPGVPNTQRAIIRRYQPYRRGDRGKAIRWLNKFSNMDKHRVLVPTVVNHSRIECRVDSNWQITSWDWLVTRPKPLNVGTPVIRVGLGGGVTDCEVKVEGDAAIHPSLGYGIPVGGALMLIQATVLEVLSAFDEIL